MGRLEIEPTLKITPYINILSRLEYLLKRNAISLNILIGVARATGMAAPANQIYKNSQGLSI